MIYRPDIDGVRGLAILLVLLFHFEIGGVDNGYLGVDIFFVISGFLMTKIILKDLEIGKFSLINFYIRRIRRLFPALFVMLLCVSVTCFIFFDNESFEKFGYSLIYSSFFSSNLWFWSETGYFAPSALEKPLLHTWSLSVEEQFYLFFPILLLWCKKHSRSNQLKVIIGLFFISLILYFYGSQFHPDAAFFLLPTRAWQLLAGTIIALFTLEGAKYNMKNGSIHYLGIILIFVSVFFTSAPDSLLPPSIPCTLGTALLLIPIKNSFVSQLLTTKPLVSIGLISYSLYLWHWPLWVMFQYLRFENADYSVKISLFLLSLLLAWLSWKFVEAPVRKFSITNSNRKMYFIPATSFLALCLMFGASITVSQGMAFRYPQRKEIIAQNEWDWHPYGEKTRFHNLELKEEFKEVDIIGHISTKPEFLLWGDSHAMALIPGLEIAAKKNIKSFYALTRSSNPPLLHYKHPKQDFFNNSNLNSNILRFIKSHDSLKTVILACAWSDYRDKYRLPSDSSGLETVTKFNELLSNTISTLLEQELKIIIISQVPPLAIEDFSTRYYFLKSRFPILYENETISMTKNVIEFQSDISDLYDFIETFRSQNVSFLDLSLNFLEGESDYFILEKNGIPLYRDSGHLSTFGSKRLSSFWDTNIFGKSYL